MSKFTFKGEAGAAKVIKAVQMGGQEVRILESNYKSGDKTMHTIRVSGAGKDKLMGPQAALAIIEAQDEIIAYFRKHGVIE